MAKDKKLDQIGIPINPHGKPQKMRWFLNLLSVPEVMAVVFVLLAIAVYLLGGI